jgi:hypothetical protein
MGLTYEKSGHKASTYRQIKQYPDPKRRGPISLQGFVLPPIVDPFIIRGCDYRDLTIEAEVSSQQGIGTVPCNTPPTVQGPGSP